LSFTDPIDISTPVNSQRCSLGDDRIRETKRAVQELLNVDHDAELTGNQVDSDTSGYHTTVHLKEQTTPTTVSDVGVVYAKESSGISELYFLDSSGNEVQLTVGGKIQGINLANNSVNDNIIKLRNDKYLTSINNAGTSSIDLIKADILDQIEFGANLAAFTMAENLAMGNNKITGLDAASANGHAVRYEQVFNSLTGANDSAGYAQIGDLIIEWGQESIAATTTDTVSLSAPFTAVFKSFVTSNDGSGTDYTYFSSHTETAASFKIWNPAGATRIANWLVIGR